MASQKKIIEQVRRCNNFLKLRNNQDFSVFLVLKWLVDWSCLCRKDPPSSLMATQPQPAQQFARLCSFWVRDCLFRGCSELACWKRCWLLASVFHLGRTVILCHRVGLLQHLGMNGSHGLLHCHTHPSTELSFHPMRLRLFLGVAELSLQESNI